MICWRWSVLPWLLETLDDSARLHTEHVAHSIDDIAYMLELLNAIVAACWPCMKQYRAKILTCLCRVGMADVRHGENVLKTCLYLGTACNDHGWVVNRLKYLITEMKKHVKIEPTDVVVMEELLKSYELACEKEIDDDVIGKKGNGLKWYDP